MRLLKTMDGRYVLETIGYTFEGTLRQLMRHWYMNGYKILDLRVALSELRNTEKPIAFMGINGGFMFCGSILKGAVA